MTDPGAFSQTAEGIDRAEALAAHVMQNMVAMTAVAQTDCTITCAFLLAEALAGLEVYAGLDAPAAIARVRHITAEKVAALRAVEQASQPAPVPVPAVCVPTRHLIH